MSKGIIQKVEALARQVADREGCTVYDVELVGVGNNRTLRVFIDKNQEPVGIEDCAHVSRGLNLLLDVDDVIPGGSYRLEVSSPGLERSLKRPEHFFRFINHEIKIQLKESLQFNSGEKKIKKLSGVLKRVESNEFYIESCGEEYKIEFHYLAKANLVVNFEDEFKKSKVKK